jgi:glucosamine--fructose-6-phosphate aminotransferase (isomerizing)
MAGEVSRAAKKSRSAKRGMSEILANIRQQPAVLETIASYVCGDGGPELTKAAGLLRSRSRVVLVGIGGSRYAATPAALFLSDAGVDARVIDASEALYYERIPSDSAVILVSRSGRTAEMVRLAAQMNRSAVPYVAVTNEPASPMATGAQAIVRVACESDRGVSIRTYTGALLTLLYVGAKAVGRAEALNADVREMASRMKPMIGVWETEHTDLGSSKYFLFLGRGYSLATAFESSLLFQELARRPAAACIAAEFRQGPIEVLGPEHTVFVFAPEGRTRGLEVALVNELRTTPAHIVEIGPSWPGLPEHLAAITQIIPLQLAAYNLALRNQERPGLFRYAAPTTEAEPGSPRQA